MNHPGTKLPPLRMFMGFLAILLLCSTAGVAADRPNILIILADDLGYGDLSSYGGKDIRTPNVDGIGARGMRFDNFYANCPVCSPTRASLLSGRYPAMAGVPGVIRTHAKNNWGYLRQDARLLPELLKKAGYHTAIVGKWHLGLMEENHPLSRGFDFFHGFLGDMMDDYYKHRRHNINYMRKGRETIDPGGHATDLFSDWAVAYIRSRTGPKEPFCLYLAYNAPHTPIQPPKEWVEKITKRQPGISGKRAKLVALIEHMDHGIGKVLDALEKTGQAENTLVIFTSDNGGQVNVGANNGPLKAGKGTVYEGGIKVPALASWPGKIAPGSGSQRVSLTMDILPTLLDALSVTSDEPFDGVSFLSELVGKKRSEARREVYFIRREGGSAYGGKTIEALRWGNWKLLQNSPFQPLELYNLEADPLEATNLAGKERGVFRDLSARLRRELQRYGTVPWQKR
ncbi:MAG: sulfatase-like hydrolase/transferase [Planctomycetota bacterium]|nr:sulfatase-like hydrolase/transferase [Planctomycetota bacterium]